MKRRKFHPVIVFLLAIYLTVSCPQGWHQIKKACYYLQMARINWEEAKKSCLKKGAGLVTIRDEEEEEEIRKFIKSKSLQTLYFWTG